MENDSEFMEKFIEFQPYIIIFRSFVKIEISFLFLSFSLALKCASPFFYIFMSVYKG